MGRVEGRASSTDCDTPHSISAQKAQSIMEAAISTLISQYKAYAEKEGPGSTLSKEEFHSLVTAQLPNYVKNASDPGAIDELMGNLDKDNSGELNFSEFWHLIGHLASVQGGFSQ